MIGATVSGTVPGSTGRTFWTGTACRAACAARVSPAVGQCDWVEHALGWRLTRGAVRWLARGDGGPSPLLWCGLANLVPMGFAGLTCCARLPYPAQKRTWARSISALVGEASAPSFWRSASSATVALPEVFHRNPVRRVRSAPSASVNPP